VPVISPFDLTGKTAVVTGGGKGLGRGISEALLGAGADVIVLQRTQPTEDLVAFASGLGRDLAFQTIDLAESGSVDVAARAVLAERPVDILVNNAGIQFRAPAAEFPLERFDEVLAVNLRAVFQLSQLFGEPMLARGMGKIVNIASLMTFQGGISIPAYAASKGAIAQLTKALCNEWAPRGVNVNAVAPGYMATDMNVALREDPARYAEISARIPAGRWGDATDIGGAVAFLSSAAADYVHGIVLPVDGGWLAR
jgi:2-deoxy-D-gluconate 3-dehydrogenase